jgi:hypothetical protein
VGICPITTLAARSRSVIAATASSAGLTSTSGVGVGEGADAAGGDAVRAGEPADIGAQEAHAIAATTTAASEVARRDDIIHQA